ncbi:MAG: GumC domain-containing protein [Planctomycetota bacterium]|jgi:hypothetical protein
MTPGGLLKIAWARKGWIAAPFAIATGVAALVGWGLASRVTYRASCLLGVTEGAHAEAVFACRSLDVLETVLEGPRFKDTRRRHATAAGLAEDVKVTVLGEGRIKLEADAPSADEAERLVAGVAEEAGRGVKVLSMNIRKEDEERIRDLEDKLEQAQRNVDAPECELAELKARHSFDVGPQGDLISRSRARLTDVRAREAELRMQLAGIDAELEALRAGGVDAPSAAPSGDAGRNDRLAALDAEIARLREDLTDRHPRLAKLLAERSKVAAELAETPDAVGAPAEVGTRAALGQALRAKEGECARVAAVLAATEEERVELAESVRAEAANAEERARRLRQRVASAGAEVSRIGKLIGEQRDAARRNRAAHVALTPGDFEKAQPIGGGPSVGWLSLAGAALGLMIGGLVAALAEALEPAIRSGEDVVRQLDLPVLATVPSLGGRRAGAAWVGTAAWFAAFLLTATFLVMLVYPGWGRLRVAISRPGGRSAAEETRR